MKELDVVMGGYLEQYYTTASAQDQAHFKTLLEMPDPDLYGLLLGRSEIDDPEIELLVKFLRAMSGAN